LQERAKKNMKGVHSDKEPPIHRVTEVKTKAMATKFLPSLKRQVSKKKKEEKNKGEKNNKTNKNKNINFFNISCLTPLQRVAGPQHVPG
jgi:hypothetical protein